MKRFIVLAALACGVVSVTAVVANAEGGKLKCFADAPAACTPNSATAATLDTTSGRERTTGLRLRRCTGLFEQRHCTVWRRVAGEHDARDLPDDAEHRWVVGELGRVRCGEPVRHDRERPAVRDRRRCDRRTDQCLQRRLDQVVSHRVRGRRAGPPRGGPALARGRAAFVRSSGRKDRESRGGT